ncbi:MAG: threonine synthase, partial [Bacteroidota bacterium]
MKYYSSTNKDLRVNLREAVFKGLAPDKGLFMPERIPAFPPEFFNEIYSFDFPALSLEISKKLFGEDIDAKNLSGLVYDAINFPTPVIELTQNLSVLELFHGPTLAFKDVGARFMARMLSLLVKNHPEDIHVLVATSGDTGSAVANGFLGVDGIKVHVLYPKNKVSKIQEIQFTTLGKNISALEVDGTFDDCQRMVKKAFNCSGLQEKMTLTSANSINLARLLPQTFYYFNAYRQIEKKEKLVFCVPSGNFGNLTAGLIARSMGLPVDHFIAATNVNDIVPHYLQTGIFKTRASLSTIANAMDVGDPSNFDRMLDLFDHSHGKMKKVISGYAYKDEEIRAGIKTCLKETGYLLDPHGSTAYLAAKEYQKK